MPIPAIDAIECSLEELRKGDAEAVLQNRLEGPRPGTVLELCVRPELVVGVAELMRRQDMVLDCITAVDWLADGQFEVIYDYFHLENELRVVVKAKVAREPGEIDSIESVYAGANWHEREAYDFFGLSFRNHPDLTRILLPEDSDFHPLRKDYLT